MTTFDSVLNFREMGGLPAAGGGAVKSGRLYRSGHWSGASDDDVTRLAEYNLATVVDFRTEIDRQGDGGPNRVPDGPAYLQLEMVDTSGLGHRIRSTLMSGDQAKVDAEFGNGRAKALAAEGVVAMALEAEKQEVFGRFLQVVADEDRRPVLWHCSAGKDRAGWAATLVGLALGVPDDALIEHYIASNIHRPVEQRLAYYAEKGIDAEIMRPFLSVDADYLRGGLAVVDERWPSREVYLSEALGFAPEQITRLRNELVD
ncbi:MAG: tyrosine-protein phosphatase [Actinomycetota bacterium]